MAGSIWQSGFLGNSWSGNMDSILDKENFELSEILGETRLLEELEQPNTRLIEYMSKKETIAEMLNILLEFDEEGNFKQAHVVAEVFSSGVEEINAALVGLDTEYILQLFDHLVANPRSLGSRKAGYIHNLLTTLVKDDEDLTLEFLNKHKDLVMKAMLAHLDQRAMAAAFKGLLFAGCYSPPGMQEEEESAENDAEGWARDLATVEAIVDKVFEGGDDNADTHSNASKLLRSLIGEGVELSEEFAQHQYLHPHVSSEDICIRLANGIFHSSPPSALSSREGAFKILTALVGSNTFRDSDSDESGVDMSEVPSIKYPCAALNHEQMCADLRGEGPQMPSSIGATIRCVGPYRMSIVKYLALVFSSESLAVTRELATHGVVDACLQLLFDYPWSSMLHVEILCIVQFIIRSYDLLMQLRVFRKFNLLTKILDFLEEEDKRNASGGGGGGHKKVLTSTNRGCLYRICLDVELYLVGLSKGNGSEDGEVDAVEASTCPIRTWAEKHKVRWQSFVIGTLRGVEERQERHLAGLPIPCPDGINIIYDAGPQSNSNASDFGLSNSMRGLGLTQSTSSDNGSPKTGDSDSGDMAWENP